jgi:Flp pilus assembly pilin Flp
MPSMLKRLWQQQSGDDLEEYALLVALVVLTVAMAVYSYGRQNANAYTRVSQAVSSASGGGGGQAGSSQGGGSGQVGGGSSSSGGGSEGGGEGGDSGGQGGGQSGGSPGGTVGNQPIPGTPLGSSGDGK